MRIGYHTPECRDPEEGIPVTTGHPGARIMCHTIRSLACTTPTLPSCARLIRRRLHQPGAGSILVDWATGCSVSPMHELRPLLGVLISPLRPITPRNARDPASRSFESHAQGTQSVVCVQRSKDSPFCWSCSSACQTQPAHCTSRVRACAVCDEFDELRPDTARPWMTCTWECPLALGKTSPSKLCRRMLMAESIAPVCRTSTAY